MSFYELPHGGTSGKIADTSGSLLTLPTFVPNTNHQLIASSAPFDNRTAYTFWRDLVFGQSASLVVNLCNDVSADEHDYWKECLRYWPAEANESQRLSIRDSAAITVTTLKVTKLFETLIEYKVKVTHQGSDGTERKRELTLIHFSGWPDLGVPESDEDIRGVSMLMSMLVTFYT